MTPKSACFSFPPVGKRIALAACALSAIATGGPTQALAATTRISPTKYVAIPIQSQIDVYGMTPDNSGTVFDWGNIIAGAYIDYAISVPRAGNYALILTYSMPNAGTGVDIQINGTKTNSIQFDPTGAYNVYQNDNAMSVALPAGKVDLKITAWNSGFNLAGVSLEPITLGTAAPMALPGLNISGGEDNTGKPGARVNYDYVYPSNAEIDYYASKGLKIIRLPFDLGRVQPLNNQPLSTSELGAIDAVVAYARTKGMNVWLDPHNWGYMADDQGVSRLVGVDPLMPTSYFADFWSRLAVHYRKTPNVSFGLMNEPHDQTAEQWHRTAIAAIKAIRRRGATQMILVPGTHWSGAPSWRLSGNAKAWQGFTDPNFVYDVHQYLDINNSGSHDQCVWKIGAAALADFTNWARTQNAKALLGELGWSNDPSCPPEAESMLSFMNQNTDVWLGYTYWAGGAWLGNYMFSLEPQGLGTNDVIDQPQMSTLVGHL